MMWSSVAVMGLNYEQTFKLRLGVYHNCLQEQVAFKQRQLFSIQNEINTLFSVGERSLLRIGIYFKCSSTLYKYTHLNSKKYDDLSNLFSLISWIYCCNGNRKLYDFLVPLSQVTELKITLLPYVTIRVRYNVRAWGVFIHGVKSRPQSLHASVPLKKIRT